MARPVIWTRPRIEVAIRAWVAVEGDPPRSIDWINCHGDHPSTSTVLRRCGSWNAAIAGAGCVPRPQVGGRRRAVPGRC